MVKNPIVYAIVGLLGLVESSGAQVTVRRLDSAGTVLAVQSGIASNTPITRDITGWNSGDWLHVFHTGDPTVAANSIGSVTLNGAANGEVRVLIGNPNAVEYPLDPLSFVLEGCYSSAGVVFTSQTQINNGARVTISAFRDLTGPVTASAVDRIDVGNDTALGATITSGLSGIDQLLVGNTLNGNVASSGFIRFVRVGGNVASINYGGINANIEASGDGILSNGRIGFVYTTGPVGFGSRGRVNIRGYDGIDQIRTAFSGTIGDTNLRTLNVNANIDSAWTRQGTDLTYSGIFQLIDFGGNFSGQLTGGGMNFNSGGFGSTARKGIFVRGTMSAPIHLQTAMLMDIVAGTFTAPIQIDRVLWGSIVATDVNGHIPSVTVGRHQLNYEDPFRGFAAIGQGGGLAPLNYSVDDWYASQGRRDGSVDGVIKAATIGVVDLFGMYNYKGLVPRIEAQSIGSLTVDTFDEGVIWSGLLEYSGSAIANNPANDYATITNATIGCMGPAAYVWYQGTSDFKVLNDVRGAINTTELTEIPQQQLRIGGGLLTELVEPDPCDLYPAVNRSRPEAFENSPRYCAGEAKGSIRLRETASLDGQIILHANAAATQLTHDVTKWQGDIVVGAGFPNPIIFNTDPSTPLSYRGPEYTKVPTATPGPGDFGSGAVGLVPFAVHRAASQFDETCIFFNRNTNGPFGRAFNYEDEQCPGLTPDPLEVEYYGPVAKVIAPSGFQQRPAVDLTLLATSGNLCAGLADASWAASTTISANQRRVSVSGSQFYWFPNGKYGYKDSRPSWGNTGGLRCDKLLTSALVRPLNSTTTRYFSLFPDCDSDCQKDTGETTCPPGDPMFGCDDVDFNNDGSVFDPTDVDAFLSVFSEGPCVPEAAVCNDVDFNNDGAAFDPCDVDSFLVRFAEGPCTGCGQ